MLFSACFNVQRNSSRNTPMSWTVFLQRVQTGTQVFDELQRVCIGKVLTQIGVTGELDPIPGIIGGDRGQDGSLSQDCIKAVFDTLGSNHITV